MHNPLDNVMSTWMEPLRPNGWDTKVDCAKVDWAEKPITPTAGVKYDDGKLPFDLLDPVALAGLAEVLKFGANKYASWNWAKGISYTRLIAALLRHTFAILRGELIDPESGLPHINHVGCCWMFLSHMMAVRPDMNDLPKRNTDGSLL